MFPVSKYVDVIKYGEYKMSYDVVKCNRCFRNDLVEYVTFKDIKLCLKCIDSINKTKPSPIPLVTMRQNMFINEINQTEFLIILKLLIEFHQKNLRYWLMVI